MTSSEILQRFEVLDTEAEELCEKISKQQELIRKLSGLADSIKKPERIHDLYSYEECRAMSIHGIVSGLINNLIPLETRIRQINQMRLQLVMLEIKNEFAHLLE